MKNILLLITIAIGLYSCEKDTTDKQPVPDTSVKRTIKYECWSDTTLIIRYMDNGKSYVDTVVKGTYWTISLPINIGNRWSITCGCNTTKHTFKISAKNNDVLIRERSGLGTQSDGATVN